MSEVETVAESGLADSFVSRVADSASSWFLSWISSVASESVAAVAAGNPFAAPLFPYLIGLTVLLFVAAKIFSGALTVAKISLIALLAFVLFSKLAVGFAPEPEKVSDVLVELSETLEIEESAK